MPQELGVPQACVAERESVCVAVHVFSEARVELGDECVVVRSLPELLQELLAYHVKVTAALEFVHESVGRHGECRRRPVYRTTRLCQCVEARVAQEPMFSAVDDTTAQMYTGAAGGAWCRPRSAHR